MRIATVVLLAAVAGITLGLGVAELRLVGARWDGDPVAWTKDPSLHPHALGPATPPPKVIVDEAEYDFGSLESTATGSHDFLFTNVGKGLLTLKEGETSCSCALSKIAKTKVPPGDSTKVTVTFKPKDRGGAYRQTAQVHTNDPSQPHVTLTVYGKVTVAAQAVPTELSFNYTSSSEPTVGEVRLYGYVAQALEVRSLKLANPLTAKYFDVSYQPLAPDQLRGQEGARSGVLLRVTVKPGLPQTAFEQTILIGTNLDAYPTITIPVKGKMGSEVSVVGSGWSPESGVLTLETVSSRVGAERRLLLLARGPHRKEVKFKVAEITPGFLEVTVGPSVPIGTGAVIQTPLTIRIPKGSPVAEHLGPEKSKYGQIRIETNHPQAPQLRIFLRFAVEG